MRSPLNCPTGYPVRHLPLFLFLVGILAYGAYFSWYMLDRFDHLISLIQFGNLDDSFYYFQIAKNLAAGQFSTFDGGITQTNGYHPLWVLLITPFYWLFDKEAALFAIKVFEIMLIAGGVTFVVLSARICRLPWVLLFAVLPVIYWEKHLWLGLEAAAALFMLGLLFLILCLYGGKPERWRWPLAAVAFGLPWVRLELAAVSVAATAVLWFIGWLSQRKPVCALTHLPSSPLSTMVPLLGACSGILVYFAYNQVVFGIPVPVSGFVKTNVFSFLHWQMEGGFDVIRSLQGVWQIPHIQKGLLLALEITVYFLLALLIWWFSDQSREQRNRWFLIFMAAAFSLAAGHMAKFAHGVIYMHPHELQYARWPLVPAYLMVALILPLRCYVAIHLIRWFLERRWRREVDTSMSVFVAGCAVFLLAAIDLDRPFQRVDEIASHQPLDDKSTAYTGTLIMNRLLPDDSVIGATDAGIIGYFSKFPVVNLDGLVNSYAYAHLLKSTAEAERSSEISKKAPYGAMFLAVGEEIVRRYEFTHIIYNQRLVPGETVGQPFSNRLLYSLEGLEPYLHPGAPFRLWQLEKPSGTIDRGEWFWELMTPHFHYRSDEIGIVMDGRLAQVFVRDCGPEKLRRRTIEFSWISENDEQPIVSSHTWNNSKSNGLGLCIAAFKLPRPGNEIHHIETRSEAG